MPTRRAIPLEQFQIQTPCAEDWAGMHGDDAKRFCDKCNKHVHDLAHVDRAQADALLNRQAAGHVCVRMARDGEGRVITRDYWKFAAGAALVAGVGLSGCESRTQGSPVTVGKMAPPAHQPLPDGQVLGGAPMPPPVDKSEMGDACPAPAPKPDPVRLMGVICPPPPKPVQGEPAPQTVQGGLAPPPESKP